jgi:hypothetical protein
MARRAWERVRREHLLEHRARALLDFAAELPARAATGAAARTAFTLGLAHLRRAGMCALPAQALAQALAALPQEAEVLACRIALAAEEAPRDEALALPYSVLAGGALAGAMEVDLAGSMAGVQLGDFALARQFWARGAQARPALPADPARLCLSWAVRLAEVGLAGGGGFAYDAARHLPRSAVQCLHLARRLAPDDVEIIRRLAAMTEAQRGGEFTRVGILSELTLRDRGDWRAGLRLGLADLRVYRVEDGLAELRTARANAAAQGRSEAFVRALAALEPSGRALAAMKALDEAGR